MRALCFSCACGLFYSRFPPLPSSTLYICVFSKAQGGGGAAPRRAAVWGWGGGGWAAAAARAGFRVFDFVLDGMELI